MQTQPSPREVSGGYRADPESHQHPCPIPRRHAQGRVWVAELPAGWLMLHRGDFYCTHVTDGESEAKRAESLPRSPVLSDRAGSSLPSGP